MSAKQRTKNRIQQRLHEKLESLSAQEEALHSVITTYVAQVTEAKAKAERVLRITDTNEFLQQYGQVEQILDKAFSTCELLTATAEDMIEIPDDGNSETKDDNSTLIAVAEVQTEDLNQKPVKQVEDSEQRDVCSKSTQEKKATKLPVKNVGECFQDSGIVDPGHESTSTGSVMSEKSAVLKQTAEDGAEAASQVKSVPHSVKKVLKNYSSSHEASSHVADLPSPELFEQKLENKSAIKCSSPKKKQKSTKKKKSSKSSKSEKTENSQSKDKSNKKVPDKTQTEKDSPTKNTSDKNVKATKGSESENTVPKSETDSDSDKTPPRTPLVSQERLDEIKSKECDKSESKKEIGKEENAINSSNLGDKTVDQSIQSVWSYNQGALLQQEITPVVVSEIVSPWCFFVQPNGYQLKNLMTDICLYMSSAGQAEPHIHTPHVGLLCLAKFSIDQAYYRAHVMKTHDAGHGITHVDVLYVDYGNKEKVKVADLRKLPDSFAQLPSQAACCAIAEVAPNNKYGLWTEEDIFTFKQYVCNQQLSCVRSCSSSVATMPVLVKLIGNYPTHAMIPSQLILQQISIGQFLVNRGSAKHMDVSDQVRLLIKTEEGKEEAAILNGNLSINSGPRIMELPGDISMSMSCTGNLSDVAGAHGNKAGDISYHGDNESKLGNKTDGAINHRDRPDNNSNNRVCDIGNHGDHAGNHDNGTKSVNDHGDNAKVTNIPSHSNQNMELSGQCENLSIGNQSRKRIKTSISESDEKSTKTDMYQSSSSSNTKTDVEEATNAEKSCTELRSSVESENNDSTEKESKTNGTNISSPGNMDTLDTASSTTGNLQSDRSADVSFQQTTLNHDLNVDLSNSPQGQEVMLAHVKSPSHFYVHRVSREVGMNLDNLMKNLNKHFEKMNRRRLSNLSRTFVPAVQKLCCAQFSQDNNFYRAVIKSLTKDQSGSERVLIFYMDFGDEELVGRHRIYPLPPEFKTMSPLATCCTLTFVKPKSKASNSDEADHHWPESSTEFFTSLGGFEKTLHMHVVKSSQTPGQHGDGAERQLGVLLVDNTGTEEVCINLELIRQGHAELDTSSGKHTQEGLDLLEVWNPMEDDFLSKRNSYNIDMNDAGVATTGYKAQDEKRVCKFFSRGQECWRGDYCPYHHVRTDSGVSLDKEPVYVTSGNQELLLPSVNSWVAIEVTTILNPGRFYAILPLGKKSLDNPDKEPDQVDDTMGGMQCDETLDDILVALNKEYSKRPSFQGTTILKAVGEIVAARFSQDQQWYRARVTQVTENKVKVFYVDFGNTEWIPEEEVVEIKPEFLHLPFQALECFLYKVDPAGNEEKWTKEAVSCFRDLVDGKTLVAHVRSSSWNNCLTVELYDTSSNDDINIGDVLVERGHAVHSTLMTESSCNVSDPSSSRRSSMSTGSPAFIPG